MIQYLGYSIQIDKIRHTYEVTITDYNDKVVHQKVGFITFTRASQYADKTVRKLADDEYAQDRACHTFRKYHYKGFTIFVASYLPSPLAKLYLYNIYHTESGKPMTSNNGHLSHKEAKEHAKRYINALSGGL